MTDTKKILLVEDNEINAKLIKDFLKFKGFDVLNINNGREVLAVANKYKPDLILMDVQLFGMSGIEATKELRKLDEFKKTPIFVISAFSKTRVLQELPQEYFEEYIEKPIVFSEFITLVENYLNT
jgi:two-component system cell cycle response regulator DivK